MINYLAVYLFDGGFCTFWSETEDFIFMSYIFSICIIYDSLAWLFNRIKTPHRHRYTGMLSISGGWHADSVAYKVWFIKLYFNILYIQKIRFLFYKHCWIANRKKQTHKQRGIFPRHCSLNTTTATIHWMLYVTQTKITDIYTVLCN